jgi:hypothetical protein
LNIHASNVIRQRKLHTAEQLVPKPSAFVFELASRKLKSHKSPGIDQIPAELFKEGDGTTHSEYHKHIISVWNKGKLPEDWPDSIIVIMYKKAIK